MPATVPMRKDVPLAETWDVHSVFASDEVWGAELEALTADASDFARFKGRLTQSPEVLREALDAYLHLNLRLNRAALYARMQHNTDTGHPASAARMSRVRTISAHVGAACAFFTPELLAADPARLRDWSATHEGLRIYAHYFEQLEDERPHVRSEEVEEVLSRLGPVFGAATQTHGIMVDSDLTYGTLRGEDGEVELVQANARAFMASTNPDERRSAWTQYADAHLAMKNSMANLFATGVQQAIFTMKTRGYGSVLEMILSRHRIPCAVFHNLVETCRKKLPVWHRYWRVLRRALNVERLHPGDLAAPMSGARAPATYDQSVAWILEGLEPLGRGYVDVARRGMTEERWVDRAVNKGKRMGAHSTGTVGTHPFIFLSWSDDLLSLSTLAHELGHSMHKHYTCRSQPLPYAGYSLFAAEVASNFNQAMVREHLMKTHPERAFRVALLEEAMANFKRYFFIMPTLARFEWEVYERAEKGGAVTVDFLNKRMAELFREGYGSEVELDEERIGITWAQFSTHIYNPYYPFQYATGISGAHALCRKVLDGGPEAAERYLDFLRAGSSLYPLDALARAGVDLSTPEPVEATFAVLEGYLEELERLFP
ncbi:MAG: oligoendopeptidase F [Planctomycetota bacterium]|nr:oligoendopeptidase F [Planctomycetota bacterium]